MKKRSVLGIAWLALTAAVLAARAGYPPAPEFSLKDLDGQVISLADMRGKVVFLNFWATWCPPCREEIPDFVAFYDQNSRRGLEIVGFSVDKLSPDDLRSFVRKNKMSYPVAFATRRIIEAYEPGPYIPATIVIDKQGRIRDKQVGGVDKKTLADWFERLSSEK